MKHFLQNWRSKCNILKFELAELFYFVYGVPYSNSFLSPLIRKIIFNFYFHCVCYKNCIWFIKIKLFYAIFDRCIDAIDIISHPQLLNNSLYILLYFGIFENLHTIFGIYLWVRYFIGIGIGIFDCSNMNVYTFFTNVCVRVYMCSKSLYSEIKKGFLNEKLLCE